MSEKKSFIKGAAILSLSGILVKLLGAALRIPLVNKLGDGMAYYNVAYSIYGVFLVLATAGIPVAVSRMVSERIAMGNDVGARKVLRVSVKLTAFIGAVSFCLCFFGADLIAYQVGIPDAALSLRAVAPALCLVPVLSAFRGYFQGKHNMMPTALSETAEQIIRVFAGLWLAFSLYAQGLDVSAAGATFGAAVGAAGGILVMIAVYLLERKKSLSAKYLARQESEWAVLKKIIWIAVPIIIGAEIMPLMSVIDTSMIATRLQATGWTKEQALNLYSQYGAYCDTLISLPQAFTQAIAIGLVPSIAGFYWQKRRQQVEETVQLSMRMTMLMACPCAVGLFVLAEPVLLTLFYQQAENAVEAADTLRVMTVGILFLAVSQTTTGSLQAIDKQILPVRNLLIGAVVKMVLTYTLVSIPAIHVRGAAIGTNGAYLVAMVLNLWAVKKYIGVKYDVVSVFVKPAAAAAIMGICVYAAANLTWTYAGAGFWGCLLTTAVGISVGILSYGAAVLRLSVVSREELEAIPYVGAKIKKWVDK